MTADAILSRLDKVRPTGRGRWLACCPAHEDRSPSLSIRETDDQRVLLHCFAGCTVEHVLDAAGLTFDALFPERPIDHNIKRERRPFNAFDVLECLSFEASVLVVVATILARGEALSDIDRDRLLLAASRIETARGLAHGA